MKTFNPKFDVKELENSYELHGELPGIEQENVEIEFTDLQTITVKGRTEHNYSSGTPPAAIESSEATSAITESGETDGHTPHKATVEDEGAETTGTSVDTPNTEAAEAQPKAPEAKYWVSERSVGEFSRSFSFPVRVDQDNVRASMKNGILSVIVPKAKKPESRKITIN
jgi:HSP20 family protein